MGVNNLESLNQGIKRYEEYPGSSDSENIDALKRALFKKNPMKYTLTIFFIPKHSYGTGNDNPCGNLTSCFVYASSGNII